MAVKTILFALAALTLWGCASSDYGYAYCYDPYRGPVGYAYGPLEPRPACATQPPRPGVFVARPGQGYEDGYVSGPYPMPVAETAVDAVSREEAR